MVKPAIGNVQTTEENLSSEPKQSFFAYLAKCKWDSVARRAEMLLSGHAEDSPRVFETLNSGKLGKLIRYIRSSGLLTILWGSYLAQRAFN